MEDYHRLLKRQIRRYLPNGEVTEELKDFLDATDRSYKEFESMQYLRDRAVKLSSQELIDKNKQLREKNELLDSFVYRVSHDLKNPLHNLISLMGVLQSESGPDGDQDTSDRVIIHMNRAINGMLERIQDLLELSRMENLLNAKPVTLNLAEEFEKVMQDQAPSIVRTKAKVHYQFNEVPCVDFVLENMRSIFSNFLSNAIKYRSPDRAPEVHIHSWKIGNEVCLSFRDNGLGIDLANDQEKLFSMFERLHAHVEGSGVGLFIVKKIVEAAGGRIEVESEVGKGTTFNLRFPNHIIPEIPCQVKASV